MHLHVRKAYSYIKKIEKFIVLFTIVNLRKIFIDVKSFVNDSFIIVTIKTSFKNEIFIIIFIVDYNKNIETKYNFRK